jgi:hypothetical protein
MSSRTLSSFQNNPSPHADYIHNQVSEVLKKCGRWLEEEKYEKTMDRERVILSIS